MVNWRLMLITLLFIAGCTSRPAQSSAVVDLDMSGWHESVELPLINHDTLTRRNLTLFLRYEQGRIEGDTLHLRVLSRTPLFRFSEDIVQLIIPSAGNDLGSGYAITSVPYLYDERLNEEGVYLFNITPAEEYRYCSAVGVRVEVKDVDVND